jgi:hypothetical protein
MLTNKDKVMFESIARGNPAFRAWLVSELDAQTQVLIRVVDGEQLRRAQGNAQRLQNLIEHLDAALAGNC